MCFHVFFVHIIYSLLWGGVPVLPEEHLLFKPEVYFSFQSIKHMVYIL